jgi:hypothetical protein
MDLKANFRGRHANLCNLTFSELARRSDSTSYTSGHCRMDMGHYVQPSFRAYQISGDLARSPKSTPLGPVKSEMRALQNHCRTERVAEGFSGGLPGGQKPWSSPCRVLPAWIASASQSCSPYGFWSLGKFHCNPSRVGVIWRFFHPPYRFDCQGVLENLPELAAEIPRQSHFLRLYAVFPK